MAGEAIPSSYGQHTQTSCLLTFGFVSDGAEATCSLRLPVPPTDAFATEKLAVLHAAGQEAISRFDLTAISRFDLTAVASADEADVATGEADVATGEAIAGAADGRSPPDDGPELLPLLNPAMLQLLRLLALPPADASRLLRHSRPTEETTGFGAAPIVSADGDDVWQLLATPSTSTIERAAYARLMRECRSSLQRLERALAGPVTGFSGPLAQVRAASVVRRGEAEALRRTLAAARAAASALPKS